jgi:serine/threonine protein kinase
MIGKTISHYRILDKIGGGGMGDVYKAEDMKLKRMVALKFLPPELIRDENAKNRFIHEAQAASALDHPNICTIHEFGQSEQGELFIAMSCYEGMSLRNKIEEGPLLIEEALDLATQLADGLSAAHDRGVIHRDIKPDNIMVTSNGILKILDFGLAKLTGQTRLTAEGATLGTAAYMSPEQAIGMPTDHRSDIFSMSVIMYEMLAGTHPFEAEHHLAIMYSIMKESPRPIRELRPEIPEKLEKIILKGMEKDPENRYDTLNQMILDLKSLPSADQIHEPEPTDDQNILLELLKDFFKRKIVKKYILPVTVLGIVFITIFTIFVVIKASYQSDRESAKIHVEKALSDWHNNELDMAQRELELSVQIDPEYSLAWSHLAALNIHLNNLDLAITQSQKAIVLDDQNSIAYYNLAYGQEEKGELDQASENYLKAVMIDSMFIQAYSALASLYIKQDQPQRAIVMLEKARILSPDSKYVYLLNKNLGIAFYHLGQYKQAINHLNFSIETQPQEIPETRYYLALSLEQLGRIDEAITALSNYIAIETDQLKKNEAQNRLQKLKN